MNKSFIVELVLIILSIMLFTALSTTLPTSVNLGWLMVYFALTLLIHGFFRDMYLLYKQKTSVDDNAPIAMRCMCLESSIGLPTVFLGIGLAYCFSSWSITLTALEWTILFSLTLLFGFAIKDLIITFKPLGIRKEKNHGNIIFKW
ncbi:hypothetical protein J3L16_00725 [Alteromonas sp. 5E99-2]|uniref:hypothetical protein n=1 Tax=Alteromonas sp. 5E99-2 TaxID=2817683 RepID=UPI001A9833F0|nr:hypothetical protein [Alteromonas sp. 5E99-2]MBO1254201.1 hypothetical protein [Alteromonas sp. 5E99-2]